MQYTDNYRLKKPELTDPANITDLNSNYDTLDEALNYISYIYKGNWFSKNNITNLNDVNVSVRAYTTSAITGGLPDDITTGLGGLFECIVTPVINGVYNLKQTYTICHKDGAQTWIRTKYCYSTESSIAYDPTKFEWKNWVKLTTSDIPAFVVIPSGTKLTNRVPGTLYFKTTTTMELVSASNYRLALEDQQ